VPHSPWWYGVRSADAREMNAAVSELLRRQAGVATFEQLRGAGITESVARAQVAARRWQRAGHRCLVAHNHVLTRQQSLWVAVLDPVGLTAVAGMSALQVAGLRFFGRETELLHVVVRRGARYHRAPGVVVHESRRFGPADVERARGLPSTSLPRSALDAAAWQPSSRYATGLLAAVVQQRLCPADELTAELRFVGRVRHKQAMRLALLDIAGGAEALGELDIASMCRRFDLSPPERQVVRRDPSGRRRYLDCEWRLPDGTTVVLEVDGSHHAETAHWEADMRRERAVVVSRRVVLRCSSYEARHEQAAIVADLRAVGVPPSCQALTSP